MIDKIIGWRHVEFNGLLLPANGAVQRARSACVPLHAKNADPNWPISNMGCGFLYLRKGRKLVVFTRHQLGKDKHPSQVMIRLGPVTAARLNGGARFFQFPALEYGPEEFDVCAIEMPWRLPILKGVPTFIRSVSVSPIADDGSEIYFAVGYPSRLTKIDGEMSAEHFGLTQVLTWARCVVLKRGDLPMLELLPGEVLLERCSGDLDGFSGGPVFGVGKKTKVLSLRGVIIRGAVDKLFFASTDWIDDVCDKALTHPALEEVAA